MALFYVLHQEPSSWLHFSFLAASRHSTLDYGIIILSLVSIYTYPCFMTGLRLSLNMYPKTTDTENASVFERSPRAREAEHHR